MELLLEEIAGRCLRNARRAAATLAAPRDERDEVSARADLEFAGAIAWATVINLHHRQCSGHVDDMAAARIGLVLHETLQLVAAHISGVMDGPREATDNRPIDVGSPREADLLPTSMTPAPNASSPVRFVPVRHERRQP